MWLDSGTKRFRVGETYDIFTIFKFFPSYSEMMIRKAPYFLCTGYEDGREKGLFFKVHPSNPVLVLESIIDRDGWKYENHIRANVPKHFPKNSSQ